MKKKLASKKRKSFLKVRAWDTDHECYAKVDAFETDIILNKDGSLTIIDSRGIDDCVVEFSTGMKDVEGKDIYQGDIIRDNEHHGSNWEVIWENAGFMLIHADREGDEFGVYKALLHRMKKVKIVGNIHQGILVTN